MEEVYSQNVPSQSETIGELAKAVCAMQQTELFALTDSRNPFFNSNYSDLSSVWSAIRAPLTENGLAIIQTTEPYPNGVIVVTTLMHESGEWIRGNLAAETVPDKKGIRTPQGLLALITYLRRCSVSAITGVCPTDDDGETVMVRGGTTKAGVTPPLPETPKSKNDTTPTKKPISTDKKLVGYTLPGVDSEAIKHIATYKPKVVVTNAEKTKFRVGKFTVEVSEDGKNIWSNVPRFNDANYNKDACVPCAVASLIRVHGIDHVKDEYGLTVTEEIQ